MKALLFNLGLDSHYLPPIVSTILLYLGWLLYAIISLTIVELPVLHCVLQFALDYRLSAFHKVQVVEGVGDELKFLSGLLLRVKSYLLLRAKPFSVF
jgi:hypothetical protein